ncbi:DUF4956 domain-containing protein [Secundilactobacillus kimchicus]|uniref:Tubulin FtsZ, GTPase n=1 Tax=Secundilactobacillus kimchicus JCM 15530 TaxID=1302272 RepID=A0A0R1HWT9_9LACO|nr:DUF4956 domain-containing protein [Secundilactobacillus kimchicus]KRK47938.1 tubulin FtsZ, GTPase [Secundilactobacillus kimchicus JCM 15530]MBT9671459.1 DUF4956 domain-containing protein [Secundilactobacillus kimchicus]
MLQNLFETGKTVQYTMPTILGSIMASIVLGLFIGWVYMFRNAYSKNFVVTLATLPVLVQLVVMLVNMNGSVGTGLAVLGAFSLIRFRSVAGSSRDIATIFWSMGTGLATGMGFIFYAVFFAVIVGSLMLILNLTKFGTRQETGERELRITIPEELDYPNLFDELLKTFTYEYQYDSVKTTTMGSVYELSYYVKLKDVSQEKHLIDEVRVRNGNLPVVMSKISSRTQEL